MSKLFRVPLARGFHRNAVQCSSRPSSEIDSIIRVDHAGELGADRIYAGQMAVLGNSKMGPLIQHMWDQEKVHKAKFEELIVKHRARPTVLVPIWNIAGYLLGAGTALMGEKAAMACTVAVESVIVEHYNDQLRSLMANPEANKELLDTIQKFRDEEQEHHDCGIDQGAEQAPFYSALTQVIKVGCKTAIAISKGLFNNQHLHPLCARSYSTSSIRYHQPTEKWDLLSAVCIERKPVITLPLNNLETQYYQLLQRIEFENSSKSNHEIRHEKDLKVMELLKNNENAEVDTDTISVQTAQDFEDLSAEEYKSFKPAPKTTEADQNKNCRSLDRLLDKNLVLLVNDLLGDKNIWMIPQGLRLGQETLRETANRVLKEKCGEEISATILGNAPFGFYKYKYPKTAVNDSLGAKIFFYKALYVCGNVNSKSIKDYQWVSREEMANAITNEKYLKSINMFLIDEPEKQAVKL